MFSFTHMYMYLSSVCVITASTCTCSLVKLQTCIIACFLPSVSIVFISLKKRSCLFLITVVKSAQCCGEEHYLAGLGYF